MKTEAVEEQEKLVAQNTALCSPVQRSWASQACLCASAASAENGDNVVPTS